MQWRQHFFMCPCMYEYILFLVTFALNMKGRTTVKIATLCMTRLKIIIELD